LNLFELSLKLKGFPIEKAKAKLNSINQLNPAEF